MASREVCSMLSSGRPLDNVACTWKVTIHEVNGNNHQGLVRPAEVRCKHMGGEESYKVVLGLFRPKELGMGHGVEIGAEDRAWR